MNCLQCGSQEGLHVCGSLAPEFEDMLTDDEWLEMRRQTPNQRDQRQEKP